MSTRTTSAGGLVTTKALPSALNDWALPQYRQIRDLHVAVLTLGLLMSLVLASLDPRDLLTSIALTVGAALCVLSTGLTFLPGFQRFQPIVMTAVPLLDLAALGLFELIPEVHAVGIVLVLMPAMWLGGMLGRKGIAVAALASAVLVVAPELLAHPTAHQGWAQAIATIVFAALAATGITISTEMWTGNVLRLEDQGDELRAALSIKDDFIALVSHELRTPLTSIIGYLDLVMDGDEPLPEEAQRHLSAVSRNADRLLLLVADLLGAHQTANVPMRLAMEPVDVAALAALSLDDAEQRATDAGLNIIRDLPAGIVISADPNRLLQVLDNLMSNAIKFTPPGGHIYVTARRQGPGLDLMVTDTGVGVDEESVKHLGDKFFRAPKTTRAAIPGIGLGLMITKSIVEAHHGTITIASQENAGTSVLVHLPSGTPLTPVTRRRPVAARP